MSIAIGKIQTSKRAYTTICKFKVVAACSSVQDFVYFFGKGKATGNEPMMALDLCGNNRKPDES